MLLSLLSLQAMQKCDLFLKPSGVRQYQEDVGITADEIV
jgi:hypothetical protein